MKNKIIFFTLFTFTAFLWAQGLQENNIPLKKVVILTSGLAYYEHSGSINGQSSVNLPFKLDTVNDALKTLVISDPSSSNPSVTYQSSNTLIQTLRSLNIDLSDMPGIAAILSKLIGTEIEIASPTVYTGRITGVEYRQSLSANGMMANEPWLILSVKGGLQSFNIKDISSIKFKDTAIEKDLDRALDLISASRNSLSRQLLVNLPGSGRRNVSISYVIPSPVWKVSYRLDLGASKPLFQGWAIIDNDSDTDWNNIELSLVAGRPASFIQELYPPYYVYRPVLPLSIAGAAPAASYDTSVYMAAETEMQQSRSKMEYDYGAGREQPAEARAPAPRASTSSNLTGGVVDTAGGNTAGGQFEFTIKNPVSLNRRMSAMFPLVESTLDARKLLIYSGTGRFPRLGAELTNTSKMKLPAGPITVYDGGVYAGDALIEFWNENEKRLISFGEDLSVTASTGNTSANVISKVNISQGTMTITRLINYTKTYTFINSSSEQKLLVTEHSKTANTELVSPKADEQTTSAYRFNVTLAANKQTVLTVTEQRPISERITLLPLRLDALLSYSSNQEIPANVRQAFAKAVELKRASDAADLSVKEITERRERLVSDQDRIRKNLEAAGNQTQQGQEYLRRLVSLDGEIDAITAELQKANANAKTAKEAYEKYLSELNL
jgi:NACalpha-BTF3-like transcription factor